MPDPVVEDANAENEQEEGHPREEQEKKVNTSHSSSLYDKHKIISCS